MNTFLLSVAVLAGSGSLAMRAVDSGDGLAAIVGFTFAVGAAFGAVRSFKTGVFAPPLDGEHG